MNLTIAMVSTTFVLIMILLILNRLHYFYSFYLVSLTPVLKKKFEKIENLGMHIAVSSGIFYRHPGNSS